MANRFSPAINSVNNLLLTTLQNLEDVRVQVTEVRAQRGLAGLKLAIATDEAARGYSVWRAFTFEGKLIVFRRWLAGEMILS